MQLYREGAKAQHYYSSEEDYCYSNNGSGMQMMKPDQWFSPPSHNNGRDERTGKYPSPDVLSGSSAFSTSWKNIDKSSGHGHGHNHRRDEYSGHDHGHGYDSWNGKNEYSGHGHGHGNDFWNGKQDYSGHGHGHDSWKGNHDYHGYGDEHHYNADKCAPYGGYPQPLPIWASKGIRD